jgi:hypothetical protein
MATLLKVLNNLADIKSAGGVALRVRTQAVIASRVESCKLNDVDPYPYLADTLAKIVDDHLAREIDELLPWVHVKAQPLKTRPEKTLTIMVPFLPIIEEERSPSRCSRTCGSSTATGSSSPSITPRSTRSGGTLCERPLGRPIVLPGVR